MINVTLNAGAQPALLAPGGMIVREREPLNLEMPFGSLDGFITPVGRFFVRNHFSIPQIDVKTWRLKIEGEVETPFELTYREVREMESRTTMDNFLLQAIAEAADTRIAFSNGWRYGAPIPPGPVTVNDLWNIVPPNPPVSTVELTANA
jgi:hypothetical protein